MSGLYIHIPFCKQKCFYCNFFSVKYDIVLAGQYIDALIKHAKQFNSEKIHSIYIGGGTPSVLSLKQIQALLEPLSDIFDLSEMYEFTFELNPESSSKEKLSLLKKLGVNRLSIGLQSVEDKSLKLLGRAHDFKIFCDVYDAARKEDFNNINVDLIYGLPNQTVKDWEEVLEKVSIFNSEHLSLYPLSVEENTFFYKNGIVANDDVQRDMYDKAVEMLADKGYDHYEISNWAKKHKESFHNTNYWRNLEYIGLGAGAAGYFKRIRYKNIADVEKYINLLLPFWKIKKQYSKQYGGLSFLETENEYIDGRLYETETIILGLRLLNEGLDINCFSNPKHNTVLLNCLKNKTLKKQNNKILFSKEYIFVSNQIISQFLDN
ncbi:MAG: radical SAM family heme chaperone HemW [Endomicrobium sp.]|jgi:oxygen-independent coproporphyrinogen-3 oxidase|nr:radical SAM family heme chaperone HemW [Endomicrobium sp.]